MYSLKCWLGPRHIRIFSCLISLTLISCTIFLDAAAQSKSTSSEFGRHLEMEVRLPQETLERFANFKAPEGNLRPENKVQALVAKTEDWVGEEIKLDADKGPYTLVVTLVGKAKTAGHVSTLWNTSWDFSEGPVRIISLPGLSKLDVKAGEQIKITKSATPVRFKESRPGKPMLMLVHARNFEFESVTVQVWSGVGENSWIDVALSFRLLAVALLFFALRWWWVRR